MNSTNIPLAILGINRNFLGFIFLVSLVGCGEGGPDVIPVSGTVRLGDAPLTGATVLFTPLAGGRPSAAVTDAEGRYELVYSQERAGALPGEHHVTISTYRGGDPDLNIAPSKERVPSRYNLHSDLKKTVSLDSPSHDFDLTAMGREPRSRY